MGESYSVKAGSGYTTIKSSCSPLMDRSSLPWTGIPDYGYGSVLTGPGTTYGPVKPLPNDVSVAVLPQEVLDEINKSLNPNSKPEVRKISASEILRKAGELISDRASERDVKEERSMRACVNAFNGLYDTELTEEQGWAFMILLKLSRAKGGKVRLDDYQDAVNYCALMGECATATRL